ncbi:MAG: Stp1/IreP family PP2C-type Ser/Thr phosphatase [Oscillospiraceae bacterium]|nr:Stp1/IreP family PP2C-type Ser/Thr phosphatase [Oscillospiraceae bacterium]
MDLWGITDSGKVRKHNQDVFQMLSNDDKNIAVLVVCDGMGGANAGNIASELAADAFMRYIKEEIESLADDYSQSDIAVMMTNAVLAANTEVFEKSLEDEEFAGMGTTLTAAISTTHGEVVANVGDSRLYHVTEDNIVQITRDHSVVEDMIERGEITRVEARRHPSRNLITRALGTGVYEPPDIFFIKMNIGDTIILCSDGLTNVVMDNEIQTQLQSGATVRESCEDLVDKALERGAPDNVTVVILKK